MEKSIKQVNNSRSVFICEGFFLNGKPTKSSIQTTIQKFMKLKGHRWFQRWLWSTIIVWIVSAVKSLESLQSSLHNGNLRGMRSPKIRQRGGCNILHKNGDAVTKMGDSVKREELPWAKSWYSYALTIN